MSEERDDAMPDLTDDILQDFIRHAVGSGGERNPQPLLADRVELLVAEVRQGRARIEALEAENERLRELVHLAREGINDIWAGDAGGEFWEAHDMLNAEQLPAEESGRQ